MREVSRAIITDNTGRVLLGKRGRGPAAGLYALIGGKPDYGESAREAIVREVMEETGLRFDPTFYLEELDFTSDPKDPWKVTYFTGLVTGELKLEPAEVEEVTYVSESDLKKIAIAFNHKQKLVEFFRSRK
jgi:8-oxo-dGTP pyrophosphatase MutT (NUDIX family)